MKLINYYSILTGGVRIETKDSYGIDIYPIKVKAINRISNKITWEVEMIANMWAQSHSFLEECYVVITDKNENILLKRDVDNFVDGDTVQNYFDIWSHINNNALGVVAGAHDGTSGEWVDMILNNKLNAILFEPLDYAIKELNSFYINKKNVKIVNKALTTNGGQISFFAEQNCGGYCSTTLLDQAKNSAMSFDNFIEQKIDSESVFSILENYKPRWFHLDLEGLDFDIVNEIIKYDHLHPEIIIYEHQLMNDDKYNELNYNLGQKGYVNIKGERLNSIAIKIKN